MEKKELKHSKESESTVNNSNYSERQEVEYVEIHGTPFILARVTGHWKITLGYDVVSPKRFDTKEEAEEYVNQKPWELILVAGHIYNKRIEAFLKERNKENKSE